MKRNPLTNFIRAKVYQKFNFTCQNCFKKWNEDNEKMLHIHHLDKQPNNNKLDNLILLCDNCHKKLHPRQLQYPRISIRIPASTRLRLETIALDNNMKLSKVVKNCIDCILNEKDCKVRKKFKRGV